MSACARGQRRRSHEDLLARGLIEEAGHDPESGAVLFATTTYFLERMGLKSLQDLPPLAPQLPEVEELEAELGQLAAAAKDSAPLIRTRAASVTDPAEGVRLQKVLAQAGIASRRACEVLISEGRVEVNSEIVFEQGRRVDPERDVIRVDGARIPPPRRHRYLALNKPRGVVATMHDPEGRRTIADLLTEGRNERLFHVGRLDTDTEGLLILTNDGDFAHRLAHPCIRFRRPTLPKWPGS